MAKFNPKNFIITLSPENLNDIKWTQQYLKDEHKDVLFFSFEHEPNISIGDIFTTHVYIDKNSIAEFKSKVVGISPPLSLPANVEVFNYHGAVLSEFMVEEIVTEIKEKYFAGKAQRSDWTVYFKKVEVEDSN
jgi:hypothetical protein